MTDPALAATHLLVEGVHTNDQVTEALQALYDVFHDLGLGQATFETTDDGPATLIVKHKAGITPDREAISRALASAGDFRLV